MNHNGCKIVLQWSSFLEVEYARTSLAAYYVSLFVTDPTKAVIGGVLKQVVHMSSLEMN